MADNYNELVRQMYEENESIELPAEYAYFIKDNLLRFLIRLARYKFVAKMISPTDRLLEVGCGSGMGAIFLGQHCSSVLGIDVSELEIGEAGKINRRTNVAFRREDFRDCPTGEKFDVVVALDVIEHMSEEDGNLFLERTKAFLKDDGMLVIGTPSIYCAEYQGALSRAAHIKMYDQRELIEKMNKYYARSVSFAMNDEVVHTGFAKLAWYYFVLSFLPKKG